MRGGLTYGGKEQTGNKISTYAAAEKVSLRTIRRAKWGRLQTLPDPVGTHVRTS